MMMNPVLFKFRNLLTYIIEPLFIRLKRLSFWLQIGVFVNINLSQSDQFKSEPLYFFITILERNLEFKVSSPSGQDTLNFPLR